MNTVIETALSNSCVVVVLAVVLAGVGRVCHRPALMHCLWVLLLIKLITPPVIPISLFSSAGVAPRVESQTRLTASNPITKSDSPTPVPEAVDAAAQFQVVRSSSATVEPPELGGWQPDVDKTSSALWEAADADWSSADLGQAESSAAEDDAANRDVQQFDVVVEFDRKASVAARPIPSAFVWLSSHLPPLSPYLLTVWIVGSCLWVTLMAIRVFRFQRILQFGQPADPELQEEVQRLAERSGLRRCPRVCVIPGAIPPLLWSVGRAKLMLPAELLQRLPRQARESVVLHELAHFHRRDHWVRLLEIVVTALYWWNPIVWWARREIQQTEEECCDCWVVAQMASGPRVYADALMQTIEFLSECRPSMPPAASGIGHFAILQGRITSIMMDTKIENLGAGGRVIVAAWALVMLNRRCSAMWRAWLSELRQAKIQSQLEKQPQPRSRRQPSLVGRRTSIRGRYS